MSTQIDIKIKELNINHYSVPEGQLERLQAFIDEFHTNERFENYRKDLIYLKADALASAQKHQEAIEVFYQLYQDETYIFPTLIAQRIAEQLLLLKRENEALTLIEDALKNEAKPVDRLFLLFCAISNLDDADAKLQQHTSQIEEISQFLGITIPAKHKTFSAKITFLRNESNKAGRRFTKLMMNNKDLPKHEQIGYHHPKENPMRIEKSILINTTPDKVWAVFTNPQLTQKMGGSYKTDWSPGSFFGWQSLSGTQITYGKIIEYHQGKYLKHELFTGEDMQQLSSVITYSTVSEQDHTILQAKEELAVKLTDEELSDAASGWEAALQELKRVAES
ncbi:MAG TPA: SRPBCC domain-containing protein [Pedobacter sp.]|uniref:SRPBCC domain-containing protein n=1 Tax=Pedobacter sp. TaxID=1411316 RepID=UPI002CD99802|nr:SRPBCC domain-containing protein [Pedobacter sp.]HMI05089.1 SRPBCC domain-containing protein [Pedobacter sp.]